jgi:hypothetical protein
MICLGGLTHSHVSSDADVPDSEDFGQVRSSSRLDYQSCCCFFVFFGGGGVELEY